MKDIFDTKNLDDILSEEIKTYIYGRRKTRKTSAQMYRLTSLFKLKNPLTLQEIIVGLYRQYGIEKSAASLYSFMSNNKVHFERIEGKPSTYKMKLDDQS